MLSLFRKSDPQRKRFGLINCMNNRGLGTESRLLRDIFKTQLPEAEFSIYKIPPGKRSKEFDNKWQSSRSFNRWLKKQHVIMTIEVFLPKLFEHCQNNGIKTIWRPNQEWILPIHGQEEFEKLDWIMTPQNDCADFLEDKYQLNNVIRNPWITNLPIVSTKPNEEMTRFILNVGRIGIGNRRNPEVVIDAFSNILEKRSDIHFTLKTQKHLDVSKLDKFKDKNFHYICKNTSYRKNLKQYGEHDFSLAPSKWEGVGFALLESLYCGTPVITVDAPPMNEWVQHKQTGYLIPASFADVELPIPFDKINTNGLNWVKAAQSRPEDIETAVLWLSDHKNEFYRSFNQINADVLNRRKQAFIGVFKDLITRL